MRRAVKRWSNRRGVTTMRPELSSGTVEELPAALPSCVPSSGRDRSGSAFALFHACPQKAAVLAARLPRRRLSGKLDLTYQRRRPRSRAIGSSTNWPTSYDAQPIRLVAVLKPAPA